MAKTPKPSRPTAMIIAERLKAAMDRDPDFVTDDLPSEAGGIGEAGALFHVIAANGRRYRIRVIP